MHQSHRRESRAQKKFTRRRNSLPFFYKSAAPGVRTLHKTFCCECRSWSRLRTFAEGSAIYNERRFLVTRSLKERIYGGFE